LAANLVTVEADIEAALERTSAIPGVLGVLIVKNERLGMKGDLPPLVHVTDRHLIAKITRDRRSSFLAPPAT
ncbi:MAG: hypothetical protein HC888_11410, partial [Candidatus Competibacteraceae bacterium]|nr:hypothetical protein [Candidatus Competibacteraceae bacterium]